MDLICDICLDTYPEPVLLSCGHRICRDCTHEERPWGRCPLCHTQADPVEGRPEVQCEEKGGIPCDFCLLEPQPAVKTCMNCEVSLCQAHLSKHNTRSPLKEHVLIEPCEAQGLAERRCPEHGRLLECYCMTDSVCICMLCCIISSHKDHKITSLEEAFVKAQGLFTDTLEAVKTEEAALNHSIENLLKQEEEVKNEEHLRRDRLESLFKEMCLQLGNRKAEVLKALSHNEEQQLSWIQTEMQKHKERKDAASHDVQELEALRDQKDLLLFIKAFSAIQARERKPVVNDADLKPMPPILLDKLTTDGTLRLFQQFLSDMQSLFKSPPVREHLTTSVCQESGFVFTNDTFSKTLIVGKHFPTALEVIRVEVDCGRNRLSFYNVSVKDGDPTDSLHLIETVSIPFSYPVHAIFKIFEGSLKLL